ncbi:MAG: NADP-dependent oxidoreductase domain-containing protein [Podila humilis]|nr:MAG: NADP-dependent oxidoreductase domain-containing protein [Podila humilis]
MPSVGLGTYRIRDQDTLDACILEALRSGYRLIDTATVYRNEVMIGNSLKKIFEQNLVPGLTRQDLFITSKLAPKDQGYGACYKAVLNSISNLQLDYIDLYLIHWPGTAKLKLPDPQNATNRMESWHALEDLYHARKLRAIGVSNYTLPHLTQLVERPRRNHHSFDNNHAHDVPSTHTTDPSSLSHPHGARTMVIPHVHQFELHPRLFQRDLVEYCQAHRIQVQAYSSLGEGRLIVRSKLVDDKRASLDIMSDLIQTYFSAPMQGNVQGVIDTDIKDEDTGMDMDLDAFLLVAEDEDPAEYAQKAAKILLRWGLQHGAVVIPKSSQPARIRSNIDLFSFEIEPSDMSALDAYSIEGERTRYCWDPTDVC